MFLKRESVVDKQSNVRFINGRLSFASVRLNVHCFEVDGVLIDTGAHALSKEFNAFFTEADVDQVVVTHSHEDHTGGAAHLQKIYGLPILMNGISIEECRQKADYPLYRQLFWGKRRPFQAKPIGETFTSRNATWDVIETPGHAKDHLSFLNQETGQLFSGDLYVHPKTKLILREESIPQIISSLQHVLTYDFEELFCCHAGYVKDGRRALLNKLSYLQELRDRIYSLEKQGYGEQEIHSLIFKKKYPMTRFSSGEWDSIYIVRSILNK
ncbi:MBL fold metallo-hydrolase [Sporosarcina thermotolerans]|uniref:MBL fold metallo-hydrolase n=1 Tax=Sporosarcina thermotolerans TaxID=633404 RepID=A0AAW9A8Y5_9BACL|nr:MBL fold metallo-hydrolase [Sporosarcina thermotolerans]MDW0117652.1 MBL fold metallo-hydrolase [Sporosarcina thermotolerans]WHT49253.1 MBL fold metallo-hydrolase [Sporosarcina thermotolerans]